MPEKEKFDLKDILLIVLSFLLIVAVIALSVSFSSYAILSQRVNVTHANSSEACISSESFEREIADNYAMPDSNIVSYTFDAIVYEYGTIDYTALDGSFSFLDVIISVEELVSDFDLDLPTYFQTTALVYDLNVYMYSVVDDIWQSSETSVLIGGAESNSIYSYSYPSYELVWDWQSGNGSFYNRDSVFSAGDSISISARVDNSSGFYQGMEFELEYEIELTRIYGYNLNSYIQDTYDSGLDYGRLIGYNEGLDAGTEQGYNQGYTEGNLAGYQTGYQEGYSAGEGDGYNEGFDTGTEQGYTQGYDEGYDRGFIVGKNTGFNEGVQQAGDYTFFSLITSVFDAPLRVILGEWVDTNNDGVVDELTGGFLNFYVPVLDVDLAPFILSMFTVCIIIIVIRFVLARL